MLPLLNLPWVPLEQIIKRWSPFELLNFSLLSNRCATAAERVKTKVDEVKWHLNAWETNITIRSASETTILVYGNPKYPRTTKFCVKNEAEEYSNIWIVSTLEKLSANIVKIFKTKQLHLSLRNSSPSLPDFWLRLGLRFQKVHYDSQIGRIPVDPDAMIFHLDNIATDEFILILNFVPGFRYLKPLKFKILEIYHSEWFTLENLLNMECEQLLLARTKINSSDLNVFFDKWKQGLFPKLKDLRLSAPVKSSWNLRINDTNEKGEPILTDVNGNRGTFVHNRYDCIWFRVSFPT